MTKLYFLLIPLLLFNACKKEIVVFSNEANENFELPVVLELAGRSCLLDLETNTLKYSLSASAAANFEAYTRFQPEAQIVFNGQTLQNDAVNNFGDIVLHEAYPIEIIAFGERTSFQLIFTSIPTVQIVLHDDIRNEPKTLAKLAVYYPDLDQDTQIDWIGIEYRGASSLAYEKKSYGFSILGDKSTENKIFQSFFGLPENSDWILDAMFIDESKLRNKSSFEIWRSMGEKETHVGIESNFVELFVNNKSLGLYAFNEDYTADLLGVEPVSVFYKGTDNSIFTAFNSFPNHLPYASNWLDWEQKFPHPNE
jgi:hypothetical protein